MKKLYVTLVLFTRIDRSIGTFLGYAAALSKEEAVGLALAVAKKHHPNEAIYSVDADEIPLEILQKVVDSNA